MAVPRHQGALKSSGPSVLIYLSVSGLKPVHLIKGDVRVALTATEAAEERARFGRRADRNKER